MDDYRIEVERLARERTGDPFYNSSIDHAAVIIEKMFRHADEEICIISKRLNGRVFGVDEVIDEASAFMSDSNHKVRIILEDDISQLSDGHAFLRLARHHPNECEIRKLPDSLQHIQYHFTVADRDSYRFEPNKDEWVAVAAFGDELGAKRLSDVFDTLWQVSSPVEVALAN